MTYELVLGDRAYSSWSLRGWLLFEKFGLTCQIRTVDFSTEDVADQLRAYAPARTVPTLLLPDGAIVSDSIAMGEELASRHPGAGHWPSDPKARAVARTLAAEMHSSFSALRSECPMSLRTAYDWSTPSDAVLKDVARLEEIWTAARSACAPQGPWLCGTYSIADAFFAPVAARIAGYSLPVGSAAKAYVEAHLSDLAFRRWRAMALVEGVTLPWYDQPHPQIEWPGPTSRRAATVESGRAENQTCPYSGREPTHLLEMDGRVFGFCNAFCRDKTVADPEAWPQFMDLVGNG